MKDRHTFIQKKLTNNRSQIVAMTKERAAALEHISPAMLDAEREIHNYYAMQFAGMGYATLNDETKSNAPEREPTQDEIDRYRAQVEIMKRWSRETSSLARGILIDRNQFEFTEEQVAEQRGLDVFEVRVQYNVGLNDYCIVRGWGDQFE